MTLESIQHHIAHLKAEHKKIAQEVEDREKHPHTESIKLETLKKKKLHLKDQITFYETQLKTIK
jgi:hypothetical protein